MIDDGEHRRRSLKWVSFLLMSLIGLFAFYPPNPLSAQQDERSVRTAFVFTLTKYVTWPASTRSLRVCVPGRGTMGPAMKQVIEGKVSDGRTIHILLDREGLNLSHCEIVYWSGPTTFEARKILDRTRGTSVLTIGEDDKFVREGGLVAFVRTGDSIQIEANIDAIKAENLNISSRFLDLALIVHKARPE